MFHKFHDDCNLNQCSYMSCRIWKNLMHLGSFFFSTSHKITLMVTCKWLSQYMYNHYAGEGYDIVPLLYPIAFHVMWNKICLNQNHIRRWQEESNGWMSTVNPILNAPIYIGLLNAPGKVKSNQPVQNLFVNVITTNCNSWYLTANFISYYITCIMQLSCKCTKYGYRMGS